MRTSQSQGQPTWVPSGTGFLPAWIDIPQSGTARGVVLVLGSVGREQVVAYRAYRHLGAELARAGYIAIRAALRGEGDASSLAGADPVAAWMQDIDALVALAAELAPGQPVQAIGYRMGATLLSASNNTGIVRRVLWDPVSGKAFLRQQSVLRTMSLETAPIAVDGGAELAGRIYTPQQTASLKRLRVVASHPGTITFQAVNDDEATHFYDCAPFEAVLQRDNCRALLELLESGGPFDIATWTPLTHCSTLCAGRVVVENWVSVDGRPGIVTAPDAGGRNIVFLAHAGSEPMDGSTGLFAELARELAARGYTCVRVERSGQGELAYLDEDNEVNGYNLEALRDTVATLRYARTLGDGELVATSVCLGAWLLLRASEEVEFDGAVLVNPAAWFYEVDRYATIRELSTAHRLVTGGTPVAELAGVRRRLIRLLGRYQANIVSAVPSPLWKALARMGYVSDPATLLNLPRNKFWVKVIVGDQDNRRWLVSNGAKVRRRLRKNISLEFVHDPVFDHAVLGAAGRQAYVDTLIETLEDGKRRNWSA